MLERMETFFANRVDAYEEHMKSIDGLLEAYAEMARTLPTNVATLLDLGCGTGLELEEIFKLHQNVKVTGIDITREMLEKLREKYNDKQIELICASYVDRDFGLESFDAAISFKTMHHLTREQKRNVYSAVRRALKPGGCYIECDYMVLTQSEEDRYFAENRNLRESHGAADGEFYHYDAPMTVENNIRLLYAAGFKSAEAVWSRNCAAIVVAKKVECIS
ncbi:MAG: class I SAM-dependent methyltransferase [Holosporaceae bacterium]|jgi:SAM-dependent methyltransferase|nr:class I SAM-dependent methyltransferase [Holosporaceae bacterium]